MGIQLRAGKLVMAVLIAALAACRDETGPTLRPRAGEPRYSVGQAPSPHALPAFPELADTILEVRLARGIADPRPELTDAELVEAVRRAGGVVSIGFRPPAAPRTRESGE